MSLSRAVNLKFSSLADKHFSPAKTSNSLSPEYVLESAGELSPQAEWTAVTNVVSVNDGEAAITDTGTASKSFRMNLSP